MVVEYSCEVEYPWTHRSKPGVQANAEDERAEQIQNIPESELPSMEVDFHGPTIHDCHRRDLYEH